MPESQVFAVALIQVRLNHLRRMFDVRLPRSVTRKRREHRPCPSYSYLTVLPLAWCLAHRACLAFGAAERVRKRVKEQMKAWIDGLVQLAVAGKVEINFYF